MKRFLQFVVACVPMIFCMMLIFYFSSQEASVSSDMSGSFIEQILSSIPGSGFHEMSSVERVDMIASAQFFVRKAAHFSIYALLGVLAMLPMYVVFQKWGKSAWAAWFTSLVYSATDEFHQTFVPGRSGELRDVLIDCAGAALGILVIYGIIRMRERQARKYDM